MLIAAVRGSLGTVPRWAWEVLGAAAALFAVWHWHAVEVRAAYTRGSDAQLAADGRAVLKAFVAANTAQQARIDALTPRQGAISKGTTDAVDQADAAASAAVRAWRVRHAAPRAAAGCAVEHPSAAIPDATGGDRAADAADAGAISVDPQVIADAAIDAGQALACRAWVLEQQAIWPK